jgi:hypothetical protein
MSQDDTGKLGTYRDAYLAADQAFAENALAGLGMLSQLAAALHRIDPHTTASLRLPLTATRTLTDAALAPLFDKNQTPAAYRAGYIRLAAMALIAAQAHDEKG